MTSARLPVSRSELTGATHATAADMTARRERRSDPAPGEEECPAFFKTRGRSIKKSRDGEHQTTDALNVSHESMLPLTRPSLNQCIRCADVPWVKESGTT